MSIIFLVKSITDDVSTDKEEKKKLIGTKCTDTVFHT